MHYFNISQSALKCDYALRKEFCPSGGRINSIPDIIKLNGYTRNIGTINLKDK